MATEINDQEVTAVTDSPTAAQDGSGASPDLSAAARIEALDGSERKLLLDQLARVHPDVVEAGFELVAQWRAECAERRRKNGRRHEHDRRRRRAEELGGGWTSGL